MMWKPETEWDIGHVKAAAEAEGVPVAEDISQIEELFWDPLNRFCEYSFTSDQRRVQVSTSSLGGNQHQRKQLLDSYISTLQKRGFTPETLQPTLDLAALANNTITVKIPVAGQLDAGELYVDQLTRETMLDYLSECGVKSAPISVLEDCFNICKFNYRSMMSVTAGSRQEFSIFLEKQNTRRTMPSTAQQVMERLSYSQDVIERSNEIFDTLSSGSSGNDYNYITLYASTDSVKKMTCGYQNVDVDVAADALEQVASGLGQQLKERAKIFDTSTAYGVGVVIGDSEILASRSYFHPLVSG